MPDCVEPTAASLALDTTVDSASPVLSFEAPETGPDWNGLLVELVAAPFNDFSWAPQSGSFADFVYADGNESPSDWPGILVPQWRDAMIADATWILYVRIILDDYSFDQGANPDGFWNLRYGSIGASPWTSPAIDGVAVAIPDTGGSPSSFTSDWLSFRVSCTTLPDGENELDIFELFFHIGTTSTLSIASGTVEAMWSTDPDPIFGWAGAQPPPHRVGNYDLGPLTVDYVPGSPLPGDGSITVHLPTNRCGQATATGDDIIAAIEAVASGLILSGSGGGHVPQKLVSGLLAGGCTPGPPPPPTPTRAIQGILTCGTYNALLLDRGGHNIIGEIPWSSIDWNRVLDDTSEATIEIFGLSGRGQNCCKLVSLIRPWKHEVGIYRNTERVWCGPVTRPVVSTAADSATIKARDISAWWDVRWLIRDHVYGIVDIGFLFKAFSDDAMDQDNSPGLRLRMYQTQILGQHDVKKAEHKFAGPELRSLAQLGVDWTTIDRDVIAGGVVVPTPELPNLLDSHFVATPDVILDGLDMANYVGVRGEGVGAAGDALWAEAKNAASIREYGLVAGIGAYRAVGTHVSADLGAQGRLALVQYPVALIEQGILAYDAPVEIDRLVPGAVGRVILEDACYPVDDHFRLGAVNVKVTAADGDVTETVTVNFMPLGSVYQRRHLPPREIIVPER